MGETTAGRAAWRNHLAFALLSLCLVGVHFILAANPLRIGYYAVWHMLSGLT